MVFPQKVRCPILDREETVYIYAEAGKLWFNGCEMYSGDSRCEECKRVQLSLFVDRLEKSKPDSGRP